MLYPFEAIV